MVCYKVGGHGPSGPPIPMFLSCKTSYFMLHLDHTNCMLLWSSAGCAIYLSFVLSESALLF